MELKQYTQCKRMSQGVTTLAQGTQFNTFPAIEQTIDCNSCEMCSLIKTVIFLLLESSYLSGYLLFVW